MTDHVRKSKAGKQHEEVKAEAKTNKTNTTQEEEEEEEEEEEDAVREPPRSHLGAVLENDLRALAARHGLSLEVLKQRLGGGAPAGAAEN